MNKLTLIGVAFIIFGIISSIIQNIFYGYVDSNGVLHDSLFLPLSIFLAVIGSLFLLTSLIQFLIKKNKK